MVEKIPPGNYTPGGTTTFYLMEEMFMEISLRGAFAATTPALPSTCTRGRCAPGESEQSPYKGGDCFAEFTLSVANVLTMT